MSKIVIHRLVFDVSTGDRERALDIQNRVSALSDRVATCIEDVLSSYEDPGFAITIDQLHLDLDSLDVDHLEHELLERVRRSLHDQAAILLDRRSNSRDGTPTGSTSVASLPIAEHTEQALKHFLRTGVAMDASSQSAITITQIKKALYESEALVDWILARSVERSELLQRLIFHLNDIELHNLVLGSSFVTAEALNILITAAHKSLPESENQVRQVVWRALFHQKHIGHQHFEVVPLFHSIKSEIRIDAQAELVSRLIESDDKSFSSPELLTILRQTGGRKETRPGELVTTEDSEPIGQHMEPPASELASADVLPTELASADELPTEKRSTHQTALQKDVADSTRTDEITEVRQTEEQRNQASRTVEDKPVQAAISEDERTLASAQQSAVDAVEPVDNPATEKCLEQKGGKPSHRPRPHNTDQDALDEKRAFEGLTNSPAEIAAESDGILPAETDVASGAADHLYESQGDGETTPQYYLHNAGIVLVATFLGSFFKNLGLIENGQFVDEEKQQRAAVLLQHFHTKPDASESSMILHKLLCGLPVSKPVPVNTKVTEAELTEIDELLASIVHHWSALKNTSVSGFKYNFLNRKAKLTRDEKQWRLLVQRESIDVLLSTLPWSVAVIKHDWMQKPIMVEW